MRYSTVGHTESYAFGDHVRRNLGATVIELEIPPCGECQFYESKIVLAVGNSFAENATFAFNVKLFN